MLEPKLFKQDTVEPTIITLDPVDTSAIETDPVSPAVTPPTNSTTPRPAETPTVRPPAVIDIPKDQAGNEQDVNGNGESLEQRLFSVHGDDHTRVVRENRPRVAGPDTPLREEDIQFPSVPHRETGSGSGSDERGDNQDPNIPNIKAGQETQLPSKKKQKASKRNRSRSGDENTLAQALGQANATRLTVVGENAEGEIEGNSGESDDRDKTRGSTAGRVPPAASSQSSATLMQSTGGTSDFASTVRGDPVQTFPLTGKGPVHRLRPPTSTAHRPGINPLHPGDLNESGGTQSTGSGGSRNATASSSAQESQQSIGSDTGLPTINMGAAGDNETDRVRNFFQKNGFLCAPKQAPEGVRRRLRMIRRLGLDRPGQPIRRETLDKFTRLACSVFNVKIAAVTIIGKHNQLFVSEIGLGQHEMDTDLGLCTHTALSAGDCMLVSDVGKDWRFAKHPLVCGGSGPIQAYCGAPLIVTRGKYPVTIGSFCVIDMKPRPDFDERTKAVMSDLAGCVVAELEQMYQVSENQQQQSMHQVTVDFLRQSLQTGTGSRRDINRKAKTAAVAAGNVKDRTSIAEEDDEDESSLDLFQEACRIVRDTLNANACAIVDASNFHVFYPINSGGSARGSSSGAPTESGTGSSSRDDTSTSGGYSSDGSFLGLNAGDRRTARNLVNLVPRSLAPTVQFVPRRRRNEVLHNNEWSDDNEKVSRPFEPKSNTR
jgi:hypothetical protein